MTLPVDSAKAALRASLRARLQAVPPADRAAHSASLRARLRGQEPWRTARSVLFYAPLPDEPDVWPLVEEALAAGKTVLLPRFDPATQAYAACRVRNLSRDLAEGKFGIREPAHRCPTAGLNRLDLALVPGVGFTADGRRLGRGKGFYDRLLASVSGAKCGIGFDEQLVAQIPLGPHDICLDYLLTPTRWVSAGRARF
jgi:5-formyltetrahydrofolate cyclo-ligase